MIAFVINIPAPYRVPIYLRIAEALGQNNVHFIFCARREPNRHWDLPDLKFSHSYLTESYSSKEGRFIHNNLDVWSKLSQLKADIVVTSGFNPTHLYAFFWTIWHGKKHITWTDGTYESEKKLSLMHKQVRKLVYKRTRSFIGASRDAIKLYKSYKVSDEAIFISNLCCDNSHFINTPIADRPYDFMFSGRMSEEKNPIFVLKIAREVSKIIGRKVSILMLGSGPMEQSVKSFVSQNQAFLSCNLAGFIQQKNLPKYYSEAKVFLFPSKWDPWGVVANEACASGQPVLVSPYAGVAGELIINGANGYVIPLNLDEWVEQAVCLLVNPDKLEMFSNFSIQLVQSFNFESASDAVVDAIDYTEM